MWNKAGDGRGGEPNLECGLRRNWLGLRPDGPLVCLAQAIGAIGLGTEAIMTREG